jgi:hypothetical protein
VTETTIEINENTKAFIIWLIVIGVIVALGWLAGVVLDMYPPPHVVETTTQLNFNITP